MDADALVIGGGIIGASCAFQLAADGCRVLLVDDQQPGATAAGMGHLVCMDDDPHELQLASDSLRRWQTLVPQLPPRCAWHNCGTLWLATCEAEMAQAQLKQQRLVAQQASSEIISAARLARLEPALRAGLAGGLRVPGDSIVYAPTVARWLSQAAGVERRIDRAVALEPDAVRLASGATLRAPVIILANGLQANTLLDAPLLQAKKGQLAITDRYPQQLHHQLVELGYGASAHASSGDSVAFNVQPRPTGQLLIGSSRQFGSTHSAIDYPLLRQMLAHASRFLPGLATQNIIRCWSGLRAATADGLPVLGEHPTRRGLWLALGHEGLGVTTAPGSAALLAALIHGQRPAIDPTPFSPARLLSPAPQENTHVDHRTD